MRDLNPSLKPLNTHTISDPKKSRKQPQKVFPKKEVKVPKKISGRGRKGTNKMFLRVEVFGRGMGGGGGATQIARALIFRRKISLFFAAYSETTHTTETVYEGGRGSEREREGERGEKREWEGGSERHRGTTVRNRESERDNSDL